MGDAAICDNAIDVQIGRNYSLVRPYSNIQFTIAYYTFGHILIVSCVVSWLLFKKRFERTRIRPTALVVMAAMCSLTQMNYAPLNVILANSYPCWIGVLLNTLIVPFGATSIIGRILFFSFSFQFAQSAYRAYHENQDDDKESLVTSFRRFKHNHMIWNFATMFRRMVFPSRNAVSSAELYVLRFLVSRRGVRFLTFLFVLPFLVLAIVLMTTNSIYIKCTNCAVNAQIYFTNLAVVAILTLFGILFWFVVRRLEAKDAWGFKSEAFYSLMYCVVAFLGLILVGFDQSNVYPYSHQLILTCGIWLFVAEQSIVQLYLGWRQEWRARRGHRSAVVGNDFISNASSAQVSSAADITPAGLPGVITPDMTTLEMLDVILRNKALRKAFEQHLLSEVSFPLVAVRSLFD